MLKIDERLQDCVNTLYEHLEHPDLEAETKKIQQKLREAKYNPGDPKPLADCILAILLAARSGGHTVDTVFEKLMKLAEELRGKRWKKMPDNTYQVVP